VSVFRALGTSARAQLDPTANGWGRAAMAFGSSPVARLGRGLFAQEVPNSRTDFFSSLSQNYGYGTPMMGVEVKTRRRQVNPSTQAREQPETTWEVR
jgi:hypothetical protein